MPQGVPMGLILLIVLVIVVLGVLPSWNHSRQWGYGPSGILGLVVVVFLCLLLFDVVNWRSMHVSY
jgi:hypothetical protein